MHYVDQAMEQFWKWLATIIAVKSGLVEHYFQVFNTTAFHCNDWS